MSNMMSIQQGFPYHRGLRVAIYPPDAVKIFGDAKSLFDTRGGISGQRQTFGDKQKTPFLRTVLVCRYALVCKLPCGDPKMPVNHPFKEQFLQEGRGSLRRAAFRSIPPAA